MNKLFLGTIAFTAMAAAVLLAGCGGGTTREDCPEGTYYEPGCGDPPDLVLAEPGCYAQCTEEGAACQGGTCRTVVINPCVCEPGQGCCAACGSSVLLCVP